jgi:PAS domain S-box-containing protein
MNNPTKPTYEELEQRCYQAEQVKNQLSARLNEAQRLAGIGSWEWDLLTNQVWWSEETYRIFGVNPDEYIPSFETNEKFIHPEDLDIYERAFEHSYKTGDPLDLDLRLVAGDGVLKFCQTRGQLVRNSSGEPIRFIGTVMDISGRKQTEEEVRKSREQLYKFASQVPGMLYQFERKPDGSYCLLFTTEAIRDLYGLSPEDVREDFSPVAKLIHPEDLPRVYQAIEESGKNLTPFYLEYRVVQPGEPVRWIEAHSVPEKLSNGSIIWSGFNMDVTGRKNAEAALKESEARFRLMFSSNDLVMLLIDPDTGAVLDANAAAEHYYEYPIGTLKQMFIQEINTLPVDEVTRLREHAAEKEQNFFIFPHRLASGEIRTVEVHSSPIRLNGKINLFSIINDITERRRIEQALIESEKKYRSLHESMIDGFVRAAIDGKIIDFNENYRQMLGYSTNELLEATYIQLTPEKWQAYEKQIVTEQILKRGFSDIYEKEYCRKDGGVFPVELHTVLMRDEHGQPESMWAIVRDITERKQAEKALRASEEKYRSLLESLDSVIATVDPDGRFLFVNDMAARQTGRTAQELIGKSMSDLFPDPVAANQLDRIREVIASDQGRVFESISVVQDQPRWYRTFIQPMHDENGRVVSALVNATDIHDLKTAQQALQELNRTLEERVKERTIQVQDLYDNAPVGYHSVDPGGNLITINQTELNWLGYTREELIGKHASILFASEQAQVLSEDFERFKIEGRTSEFETVAKRKDETTFPVMINAMAVYDAAGKYVSSRSTLVDITERKRQETALHTSQSRLEMINEELEAFSYSVSHDLRAPLRHINAWASIIEEDYHDLLNDGVRNYLEQIKSEALYMGELIDDLLKLSRVTSSEMQLVEVDLSALAQSIIGKLQNEAPDRKVDVTIQPGLMAMGDAHLLVIVLTNLLDNAWKYTSKRETARIEFGIEPTSEGRAYFVRDNGAGFDMTYANKLFGAFQRMHSISEFPGTGIGLATVQRIIRRHLGKVWADAQVNVGATFYFTLEIREDNP